MGMPLLYTSKKETAMGREEGGGEKMKGNNEQKTTCSVLDRLYDKTL